MTIYRGPGGGGDATTDSQLAVLETLAQQSTVSAANAASSASEAASSASSAATSATNASNSASAASSSASAASTSASNAATSATDSANSATASATSATNAANSASAAAASVATIDPPTIVRTTGDQTIGGTKTFSSTIVGSITGNAETATNGVVTTGSYANPTWITSLAGSKVSGNITGNANNVTGTVAVVNGGTGATSAVNARTNLGLVIGADVQSYDPFTAKTNVVQSFTAAQRGTISALTDGATITANFALGNNFNVTLAGNRTLAAPTNLTAGQHGVIVITQDATGSRTLAYNSVWKFPAGVAPSLTTTANAVDVLVYYVESATRITARLIGDVK